MLFRQCCKRAFGRVCRYRRGSSGRTSGPVSVTDVELRRQRSFCAAEHSWEDACFLREGEGWSSGMIVVVACLAVGERDFSQTFWGRKRILMHTVVVSFHTFGCQRFSFLNAP